MPALWEPLLDVALKALMVDAGTLMTVEGDYLVRRVAKGLGGEIMKEAPIPREKGGVSWGVVSSGKSSVVNDLTNTKVASQALKAGDFHSLITVPMIVRGQVIGVMSIFTHKERNFSEEDLNLFETIANQAAVAIISLRSSEILEENRRRLAELSALNNISKSISTLFNFEETLYSIIGLVVRLLRADKGALALFDHREKLLRSVKPAFGLTDAQIRDFRGRTDEGITGQAFCKGIPVVLNQIDKETNDLLNRAGISGVKSAMAAPLRVKSQTLGVIHAFSNRDNNFSAEDLRLIGMLSSQAAVVVSASYAYRQIEEERKKDEALLTSIAEGVLAVDTQRRVIMLNSFGEKITGFLQEELIDKELGHVFKICDKNKMVYEEGISPIDEVFKTGRSIMYDDLFLSKHDGSLFPANLSIAPIRDADDRIIGAILVFRDITKEQEVEQMRQELISIATHELRAPITGIKGYLDMVLAGDAGQVGPDAREMIEEVVKINQRLADLVDDLLNVGRIEQGRIEIKLEPLDFNKLAEEVIKEFLAQAKDKNLELVYKSSALPEVKADQARTRQVLVNLVSNAIKYTPAGKVEVSVAKKSNELICSVKDTGLGISKEEQKKLFEKFYRVKTEKTREIMGTGLGLWITKQLVEMMGGKIGFNSIEGKGSTFSFSLPLA